MNADLNLFVVFEAIYSEGNVTKAAKTLNLSQPAISHSLAKLRTYFDDPLFVRQKNHMQPTPLAENIIDNVRNSIHQLNLTIQQAKHFCPSTSNRRFTVSFHPSTEAIYLPFLQQRCAETAPHTQFTSTHSNRKEMSSKLTSGSVDLILDALLPVNDDIFHQPLPSGKMVVAVNKQHSQINEVLSLESYLTQNHILVSSRSSGLGYEDFELGRLGLNRNVSIRCQQYFTACSMVANTDMILTLPENIAQVYQEHFNMRLFEMPVEMESTDIHLYWHKKLDKDPANIWLRQQIFAVSENKKAS